MSFAVVVLAGDSYAAKVLAALAASGQDVHAIAAPCEDLKHALAGRILTLPSLAAVSRFPAKTTLLVNALDPLPGKAALDRRTAYASFRQDGYHFLGLTHPTALSLSPLDPDCAIHLCDGAIVARECSFGFGVVIGAGASIGEGCHLGEHVLLAPNAVLCEGVSVGDGAFLGRGSCVLPGIPIGARAVIAPGCLVSRPVPAAHILRSDHDQPEPLEIAAEPTNIPETATP